MSSEPRRWDLWDVSLLLLALGGTAIGFLACLALAAMAILPAWHGEVMDTFFPVWAGTAFGALGVLGLPALYWSARSLLGGPQPAPSPPRPVWKLGVALFPVSLSLGYLAFETEALPQEFGLLAHLLAAGAPVLATAALALQLGPPISIRRRWGHFLAGLWVVPPVSLLLELLALIPVILLLVVGLSASADGRILLNLLAESPVTSEADVQQLLMELLSQPWLILLFGGYIILLVPLLEEGLKTMAVWPLLGRRPPPSQAFLGGLLGGVGYALFESLFLPQPGGDWAATMLARGGTPLIHGLCTALSTWGLFEMANARRWGRTVAAYVGAVALHGMWNLGALTLGISGLWPASGPLLLGLDRGRAVGLVSSAWLVVLSLLSLGGLIFGLRRLGQQDAGV